MPRLSTPDLDLSKLYEIAIEQPTLMKTASSPRLKFAENEERFERIGFDLFRDNQSEYIWRLEKDSESGEEFICRTASKDSIYQISPDWKAEYDSGKNGITLIYKGYAVRGFKKAELQFDDNNIDDWRRFLLDKISTDPTFLKEIVQSLSGPKRQLLASKCPELFK